MSLPLRILVPACAAMLSWSPLAGADDAGLAQGDAALAVLNSNSSAVETIFTKAAPAVPANRAPVPDKAALREANAQLKKLYAESFVDKSERGRRALWKRLVADAATQPDPVARYALLDEALTAALASKHAHAVWQVSHMIGSGFAVDGPAVVKENLAKVRTPPAAAMLTLLDVPQDPAANAVAGRYYAFELRDWTVGLPLLALGGEAPYGELAVRELAKPTVVEERHALAKAWYGIGGAKTVDAVGSWRRAMWWYEQITPGLSGMVKLQAQADMDAMFGVVFPTNMDWKLITAEQWDRLRPDGSASVVANKTEAEVRMTLPEGVQARVVPHPTDTWSVRDPRNNQALDLTWVGGEPLFGLAAMMAMGRGGRRGPGAGGLGAADTTVPLGALVMWTDAQPTHVEAGVITGPGPIKLASAQPTLANRGTIRVKVLLIEEE